MSEPTGERRPPHDPPEDAGTSGAPAETPLEAATRRLKEQGLGAGASAVGAAAEGIANRVRYGTDGEGDKKAARAIHRDATRQVKDEVKLGKQLRGETHQDALRAGQGESRIAEIERGIRERQRQADSVVADASAGTREDVARASRTLDTAAIRTRAADAARDVHEAELMSRIDRGAMDDSAHSVQEARRIAIQTRAAEMRAGAMRELEGHAADISEAEGNLRRMGQSHLAEAPESGFQRAARGVGRVLGFGGGAPNRRELEQRVADADAAADQRSRGVIELETGEAANQRNEAQARQAEPTHLPEDTGPIAPEYTSPEPAEEKHPGERSTSADPK